MKQGNKKREKFSSKIVINDDISPGFVDNGYNEEGNSNGPVYSIPDDESKDFLQTEEKRMVVSEETLENGNLVIILNKQNLNRDAINMLYEVIISNPGNVPVELKISNGNDTGIEKTYRLAQGYKVKCDDPLFSQLREKFKESIKWDILPDIK